MPRSVIPVSRRLVVVLACLAGLNACARQGPAAPVSQHAESRPALSRAETSSGVVVVQAGDTLYGIARRTGAPLRGLIDANHLQAPYRVQAGQRLQIPRESHAASAPTPVVAETLSARAPFPPRPQPTVDAAPLPAPAGGMAQPVPPALGGVFPPALPPTLPQASSSAAPRPAVPAPPPVAPSNTSVTVEPRGSTAETSSAAAAPSPPATSSPAASPPAAPADAQPPSRAGRFLWPLRGNILSGFGPKPGGLQNDGINIAAARGASVRAAENGIVVYAGNELKGFGNLLLVRHADGWMTAYAHLDEILVERGASVQRGQAVAKVGQTGSVASPQLHFEMRRAGRAVDPRSVLAPIQTAAAE